MALSAVEKQTVFIKNLDESIKKEKTDDLPAYDLSEVQDLILRKTRTILGKNSRANHTQKHINCCFDQSETDTVFLS